MVTNDDPHNEITLTAFRLVTMDLLELFKVMNEGTINVLGESSATPEVLPLTTDKSIISKCQGLTQSGH